MDASKQRVVTIGKFDGIHLGHQKLIQAVVGNAKTAEAVSCLITFDRHPDSVLKPGEQKRELIGKTQKFDLISGFDVDELLELCFEEKLANEEADAFVERVLVLGLYAKSVVVGADFRFGKGGKGDVKLLTELGKKFGFSVEVQEPVMIDGVIVSTSRIRDLLEAGDVTMAAKCLGRLHSNRGVVEHGLKIGRQLGFPTANLSRTSEGYLPLDGVYAGWLIDGTNRYPTALSVGINETIQAVPRLVEAHVIDCKDLDLYDREVTIEYVEFIRPALKFDSVDALVVAINGDLDKIRAMFKSNPSAN